MTHSEIRAHLSEYLERDLSGEQRSRIGAHLETCADCERELQELRATVSLLRGLPEPELPAGIAEAVMTRIARGEGREARVFTLFRRAAEPRFAAPLAAGLAGFFLLVQSGDSDFAMRPAQNLAAESPADAPTIATLASLAEDHRDAADAWRGTPPEVQDQRAGVVSSVTPAAAVRQYVSRVRMEEARRRAMIQEFAQQLRGSGHPNSASLASHFETRGNVVLADYHPR